MPPLKKDHITIEEPFLRYIADEKFSIYRRGLFLLFVLGFLFFTFPRMDAATEKHLWRPYVGMTAALLGPIGMNMFILIPKLLFKERYFLYSICLLFCIIFFYTLLVITNWGILPHPQPLSKFAFGIGAFIYLFIVGILCAATAAIKLFQRWINDRYRIMQLENNLIHSELNLLKTNISPHFLFNMLNNCEVLIQTNPLKARQVLIRLSEFLRYQLYDSSREKVLLNADIRFLHHFLSLEKIRRDYFEFDIQETGTNCPVEISPLIFIPLVENAVKHNIASGPGAYVQLSFNLDERQLVFTCENPVSNAPNNQEGGFGLPNLRRRLELLYPERHQLSAYEKNGVYTVTLILIHQ